MKTIATMLAVLLIALPAIAAPVDGNWSGSVSTPNGDLPVGFSFKAEDDVLKGSMTAPDGTSTPISDGKIDGNVLTFNVDLNFNGNVFSLAYKGVLEGEQIKFTSDFQGQVFEFVVKKVK
jgi:hypothetical protein